VTSLPRPAPNGPRAADLRRRLVGRLVVLEPLRLDHESGLVDAAQDAEVFTWLPEDMASSAEHLRRWLARAVEAAELGREAPYAILQATTGEPVGSTRFLELRFEHLRVEIGWTWLARRAWGTGINAETKLLLLGQAFERVGLRRVEFKTDARNERSRRALLAIGAQFEGILRKHMVVRDGGARDSAYYSVIDDDWGSVKALLERRVDASVAKPSGAP
jgi:RimJ/RimL family protein N-acetyltransferase